jgi:hypothetical protein
VFLIFLDGQVMRALLALIFIYALSAQCEYRLAKTGVVSLTINKKTKCQGMVFSKPKAAAIGKYMLFTNVHCVMSNIIRDPRAGEPVSTTIDIRVINTRYTVTIPPEKLMKLIPTFDERLALLGKNHLEYLKKYTSSENILIKITSDAPMPYIDADRLLPNARPKNTYTCSRSDRNCHTIVPGESGTPIENQNGDIVGSTCGVTTFSDPTNPTKSINYNCPVTEENRNKVQNYLNS